MGANLADAPCRGSNDDLIVAGAIGVTTVLPSALLDMLLDLRCCLEHADQQAERERREKNRRTNPHRDLESLLGNKHDGVVIHFPNPRRSLPLACS